MKMTLTVEGSKEAIKEAEAEIISSYIYCRPDIKKAEIRFEEDLMA